MAPVGPVNRIRLTIEMFSNEDFYLELPVAMPEGSTLAGATASAKVSLGSRSIVWGPGEILIDNDTRIIMHKHAPFPVAGLKTKYTGDIRLTFPGGHDVVSHEIVLTVKKGAA